jgi:hypothetical protein
MAEFQDAGKPPPPTPTSTATTAPVLALHSANFVLPFDKDKLVASLRHLNDTLTANISVFENNEDTTTGDALAEETTKKILSVKDLQTSIESNNQMIAFLEKFKSSTGAADAVLDTSVAVTEQDRGNSNNSNETPATEALSPEKTSVVVDHSTDSTTSAAQADPPASDEV